jgi:hypothetical protein
MGSENKGRALSFEEMTKFGNGLRDQERLDKVGMV